MSDEQATDYDGEIAQILGRLLSKAGVRRSTLPSFDPPCGMAGWEGIAVERVTYCHGGEHMKRDPHTPPGPTNRVVITGRCPFAIAADIRQRADEERKRLAGPLAKVYGGFPAFNPKRHPKALDALRAAETFSSGKPPTRSLLFSGPTGLGKTHLLLASHFALLDSGIASAYVTAEELRPVFRALLGYDAEAAGKAHNELRRLATVAVLHLDDLGRVRGTDGFHADFRAGLLRLLDERRGPRFVAFNCTGKIAREHPDLGDQAVSRLMDGADVVKLEGKDLRIEGAAEYEAEGDEP